MKKWILLILVFCCCLSMLDTATAAEEIVEETIGEDEDVVYTGLGALSDYDLPAYHQSASYGSMVLPSSVDLSESYAFPPIGDQKGYGSCAAWATTYYQFGYEVAQMENWNTHEDSTKLFSPKFVYNIVNNGEDYGTNIEDCYSILESQGAVRYHEFPYPTRRTYNSKEYTAWCTDTNALTNALEYRVCDSHSLSFAPDNIVTPISSPDSTYLYDLKRILSLGHVIVIKTNSGESRTDVYHNNILKNDYWNFNELSNGEYVCISVRKSYNIAEGYHAMTIVGYNDNIWYDYNGNGLQESFEMGAFKLANSWSTRYGNDGFIWLMYDALNKESNYAPFNNESINRKEAFVDYGYHYIDVEKKECKLIANITVSQTKRNEIQLKLGDNFSLSPETYTRELHTFLDANGGNKPIGGVGGGTTATFPFDYSYLAEKCVRSNYYVIVKDTGQQGTTSISRIVLKDKTNHVVVDDTTEFSVGYMQEIARKYKLGILGDVNDDGIVDIIDSTLISRVLACIHQLSDQDLITSDINQDGVIDIVDVTIIQRYLSHLNSSFQEDFFVDLEGPIPTIIC